jgi:maleate isomerase
MKRKDFIKNSSMLAFGIGVNHKICRDDSNAYLDKWQPDGLGSLAKIGVLTPDFDPVPESEIQAMSPRGISIHTSRVKYIRNNPASFANAPHIDNAVELLAASNPKVILYAFASSSYANGADADEPLRIRLEEKANGIPVIITCRAASDAFKVLGAHKIAVIHPPWFFNDEVITKAKDYFAIQGFEVVFCNRLTPARNFTEVAPAEVYEWVKTNAPKEADAIFFGGNGLRTVGTIAALEKYLRKPVISPNQVLLWAALRSAGIKSTIKNYGKIFNA